MKRKRAAPLYFLFKDAAGSGQDPDPDHGEAHRLRNYNMDLFGSAVVTDPLY